MSDNKEPNYHEFNELPAWTRSVWSGEGSDRKVVNDSDPYKWSGDNEPPKIGDKVTVYMNGIGAGKVVGYFAEYGWFGVLVRPSKAPEWYRKQNGRYTPAHVFGVELQPYKPVGEE